MLVWMSNALGRVGVEHGVVRAREVQEFIALQEMDRRLQQGHAQLLAQAREAAAAELAAAREEARRLVREAQAQAAHIRQQAHDEGTRQATGEWHDRLATAAVNQARVVRDMHDKLAGIVTLAVERIVRTHEPAALYQRALNDVQQLTRGATALKLRVGPGEAQQARDGIDSIRELREAGLQVEVVEDSGVAAGGCVLESDLGTLDASLQTQLDSLRAAMARAVRQALAGSTP